MTIQTNRYSIYATWWNRLTDTLPFTWRRRLKETQHVRRRSRPTDSELQGETNRYLQCILNSTYQSTLTATLRVTRRNKLIDILHVTWRRANQANRYKLNDKTNSRPKYCITKRAYRERESGRERESNAHEYLNRTSYSLNFSHTRPVFLGNKSSQRTQASLSLSSLEEWKASISWLFLARPSRMFCLVNKYWIFICRKLHVQTYSMFFFTPH